MPNALMTFYGSLKWLATGVPHSQKIFVIGTGRSGTTWLGEILNAHRNITATIEDPVIFDYVTKIALDTSLKGELFHKLLKRYNINHCLAGPNHYADKSHPLLWIAEDVYEAMPESRFVGITRDPYATVASMLKHEGILSWIYDWEKYPIPNPFLGITVNNAKYYGGLSLAARCALRWQSHTHKLQELSAKLNDRYLLLQFEEVIQNPETELIRLQSFLQLQEPFTQPTIKRDTLNRWRSELTNYQLQEISEIISQQP